MTKSNHQRALELIPWYVTATLSADDRREIEKHLGECLPCRSALRDERRLHQLVRGQDDCPLSVVHGVSDLLARIEGRSYRRHGLLLKPRLAYGLLLLLVLIAGGFLSTTRIGPVTDSEPAGFSTLSDSPDAEPNRIDIIFAAGIESAAIEALIEDLDGRLLGGPSELGRYTVAIPTTGPSELDAVIAALANDPRIRFAGRSFIEPPGSATGEP